MTDQNFSLEHGALEADMKRLALEIGNIAVVLKVLGAP